MKIYYDKSLKQYIAQYRHIIGMGNTREEAINLIMKYVWS